MIHAQHNYARVPLRGHHGAYLITRDGFVTGLLIEGDGPRDVLNVHVGQVDAYEDAARVIPGLAGMLPLLEAFKSLASHIDRSRIS